MTLHKRLQRGIFSIWLIGMAACQPLGAQPDFHATQVMQSALQTVTAMAASSQGELPSESPSVEPTLPGQPTTQIVLSPTATPLDVGATSQPSSIPAATATPAPPAEVSPVYQLAARFDYSKHYLAVDETVFYTNHTGETLREISLDVEANRQDGIFTLGSVKLNGESIANVTLDGALLSIPLPKPLSPGNHLELSFSYELAIPAIPPPSDDYPPVHFGYSERQTNLVDWYPYIPVYHASSGWAIHEAGWFGEHQAYPSADVSLDVELINPPNGLVLAASAPEERKDNRYHYQIDGCRNFAISASTEYVIDTVTAGGVTLKGYAFPWDTQTGKAALETAAQALSVYTRKYGPYPHPSLSVVEADFLDGMEYDGLFFLGSAFYNLYDGTPQSYLVAISAHETAHQWWYGLVGNDQASEPWLDEGLSTYSEKLFYDTIYPQAVDWWLQVRINYFQPTGKINHTIYDYPGFGYYRNAVYFRGALFMIDLQNKIGDEEFFAFLQDYVTRYSYMIATQKDFFDTLSKHTRADISSLMDEYFDSTLN